MRLALAQLSLDESRITDGAEHLQRALKIALETNARPVALAALALGTLFMVDVAQADSPSPAELLRFVAHHPAAWHHTRQQAQALLDQADGLRATQQDTSEKRGTEVAAAGPVVQALIRAYRQLTAME